MLHGLLQCNIQSPKALHPARQRWICIPRRHHSAHFQNIRPHPRLRVDLPRIIRQLKHQHLHPHPLDVHLFQVTISHQHHYLQDVQIQLLWLLLLLLRSFLLGLPILAIPHLLFLLVDPGKVNHPKHDIDKLGATGDTALLVLYGDLFGNLLGIRLEQGIGKI